MVHATLQLALPNAGFAQCPVQEFVSTGFVGFIPSRPAGTIFAGHSSARFGQSGGDAFARGLPEFATGEAGSRPRFARRPSIVFRATYFGFAS